MDTLQGLTGLTLSDSTLTSINLEKSALNGCTLTNLSIHNSTVTASVLTNCRIDGSILKLSCIIKESKLYKCKIFNMKEIMDCELTECELAFERHFGKVTQLRLEGWSLSFAFREREKREDVLLLLHWGVMMRCTRRLWKFFGSWTLFHSSMEMQRSSRSCPAELWTLSVK